MRIARSGRARISLRNPQAMGECDRCGFWCSRAAMSRQFQWGGTSLIDTGLLVCRPCLDVPQPQFKSPILPGDPRPVVNPRPSPAVTPPAPYQPLPVVAFSDGSAQPATQGFTIGTSAIGGPNGIGA